MLVRPNLRLVLLALLGAIPTALGADDLELTTGGNRRVVIPIQEANQELPPLLSVPPDTPIRSMQKPCRTCAPDYNPNYVYLPERSPDWRAHEKAKNDSAVCSWVNASYLVGLSQNLGDVDRHVTHGLQAGGGLWLNDAREWGLDVGFIDTHDTYHQNRANGVLVNSPMTFYTLDSNLRALLTTVNRFRFLGLLGYRYLSFSENLFLGTSAVQNDFQTANDVQVGQVGLMVDWKLGPYSAEFLGKVGFGENRETNRINGTRSIEHEFVVVPEAGLKIAYHLGLNVRTTFGYSFLYVNHVVRPDSREPLDVYLHALTLGLEARF